MNSENRSIVGLTDGGDITDPALPVVTFAREARPNTQIAEHQHLRAQLLFALNGVMEVVTTSGAWLVPPRQAVWIPPQFAHVVRFKTQVSLRSAYVHPEHAATMSDSCQVLSVPDLLSALVLRVMEFDLSNERGGRYLRLCDVLLDELRDLKAEPLHLPLPSDPRLLPIVTALQANPGDTRSLDEWANAVGASPRTLARAFKTQTGLSFSTWRSQLRLHHALTRLGAGDPMTAVALDLGYHSSSAFIAMFKRALGAPPARYLRQS